MREEYAKASVVAIIFMVSVILVGYGIMVSSAAQPNTEKSPITVGILDPDYGDTISGKIMIRALVYHSRPDYQANPTLGYAVSVLLNGTEIGTSVPLEWDSASVEDDLWNITVLATDSRGNAGKDEILVTTKNYVEPEPNVIMVGILSPNAGEVVSGGVWIDAMIFHSIPSLDYEVSVLLDGTEIGTSVPLWYTKSVEDGWHTITVLATDSEGHVGSDEVSIDVDTKFRPTPKARVYVHESYELTGYGIDKIDFDGKDYDSHDHFILSEDTYYAPEDGYYLFIASITFYVHDTVSSGDFLTLRVWTSSGYSRSTVSVDSEGYVTITVTDIVFCWFHMPLYVDIIHLGDITIVGQDAEDWNYPSFFSIIKVSD